MKDASIKDRIEREDLVAFINTCFAGTGQQEFYSNERDQSVTIDFLHTYILGNYRRLYARTLAAGINHFNQTQIILNLLAAGAPTSPRDRVEEGELLFAALRQLPPQRAFQVLRLIGQRRINNRRARALVRRFLADRANLTFESVKYRAKLRVASAHAHLSLPGEIGSLLFERKRRKPFETKLFEAYRKARHSERALYDLPFTIAEGLAAKHGVPRERFLSRIQRRMTAGEKLRLQRAALRSGDLPPEIELGRMPLTRLATYVLALPEPERRARLGELDEALRDSAHRAARHANVGFDEVVATVLDTSYSCSGSSTKKRRPLAIALATCYLMESAARRHRAFWTPGPVEHPLLVKPRGQTALARPLLDALTWGARLIVIVSDGYENAPPGAAGELVRVFRKRIDPHISTEIIHANPVFDTQDYAPRTLGPEIPTVGVRNAEDIPTMLGFARFATGTATLGYIERYLELRVRELIDRGRT